MDLYQLLSVQPFVDPEKLTSKLLHDWNWDFEAIKKGDEPPVMPESGLAGLGMQDDGSIGTDQIPEGVAKKALGMLGGDSLEAGSPLAELSSPVNLLNASGTPPTPRGVPASNPRGLNRGGKVNTNIALNERTNPEAQLQNRANNIQR